MDTFLYWDQSDRKDDKTLVETIDSTKLQDPSRLFQATGHIRKRIADGSFFVHTWKHSYVHQEGSFHCSACAWLRVASVQGKTRQQADGTAGPLKIDTELHPSPSRAIPMQMNCTDTDVTRTLAGIDFSKGFKKVSATKMLVDPDERRSIKLPIFHFPRIVLVQNERTIHL